MLSDSSHGFSKVEQVYHFADVIIDDLYWQAISPVWWTKTPPRFWALRRLLRHKSEHQTVAYCLFMIINKSFDCVLNLPIADSR